MPGPDVLAVYGSLRWASRAAHAPAPPGLRPLGPCVIPGRLYDLGPYPALVPDAGGRVAGDLCRVAGPADWTVLDEYEDVDAADPGSSPYVRRRLRLRDPDVAAWVHVYNRSVAGLREVPGGDWAVYLAARDGGVGSAEGVGFEPTDGGHPSTVFKTVAFDRSATPPGEPNTR